MSITGKRKILSSTAKGATYYHPRAVLQAFMVSWLTFERKCRCINCLYISIHPPGRWPFSYTSCSWVTLSHPSMYDLPPAYSHYRPFSTPLHLIKPDSNLLYPRLFKFGLGKITEIVVKIIRQIRRLSWTFDERLIEWIGMKDRRRGSYQSVYTQRLYRVWLIKQFVGLVWTEVWFQMKWKIIWNECGGMRDKELKGDELFSLIRYF